MIACFEVWEAELELLEETRVSVHLYLRALLQIRSWPEALSEGLCARSISMTQRCPRNCYPTPLSAVCLGQGLPGANTQPRKSLGWLISPHPQVLRPRSWNSVPIPVAQLPGISLLIWTPSLGLYHGQRPAPALPWYLSSPASSEGPGNAGAELKSVCPFCGVSALLLAFVHSGVPGG